MEHLPEMTESASTNRALLNISHGDEKQMDWFQNIGNVTQNFNSFSLSNLSSE